MNCTKCGKNLGFSAVLKGKDICKRCYRSFLAKAKRDESGLLVVEAPKEPTAVPVTFEV